jgi:hypothetical protein
MAQALIQSNFDVKWFQIAVAHERVAIEARKRAMAAPVGSKEMGEAFDEELQATMVVVAAAAFAIDALYVKVDELLGPAERSSAKSSRAGRIVETFKLALDLGKLGAEWQESIDLRDELVHFSINRSHTRPANRTSRWRAASTRWRELPGRSTWRFTS